MSQVSEQRRRYDILPERRKPRGRAVSLLAIVCLLAAGSGALNAAMYLPGAFHAGKTDMNDSIRWLRFSGGCTCWALADMAIRPVGFT